TEKKSQLVLNLWNEIQILREENIAVRIALLGNLNTFGTSLTQYVRVQEELNEGVKLPARRRGENITMNVKKIRVNGQDSQLDNNNEE
ncbi:25447_t:CDS:2, partial [Racocetra persica]